MPGYGTVRRALMWGAVLVIGLTAGPARATNGYIANGYGGGSKGMAGAGVAVPTGVLGLAQNPAMGLKVGNMAGLCLTTFVPERGFEAFGGTYDSRNDVFFIPCGGVNFLLNDRTSLAFFMFGNGGMNTEYEDNPFQQFLPPAIDLPNYGVNLEQLFIAANLSYAVTDRLTFGIAPVMAIQRFEATGLGPFRLLSSDPANVTDNGADWSTGYGINIGVLYEPNDNWAFAAAYRSEMQMEAFNKYSGLFAEQGDFDIAAVATLGAAYTLPSDRRLTFTAEYQRIFYGSVASIANSGTLLGGASPGLHRLGEDDGPGFGWKDMDVFRVGAIFRANSKWTLRGGVSYASSFIDGDEVFFNTLAPATPQWHASVGASYRINDKWGVTGSYTRTFLAEKEGAKETPIVDIPVTLQMDQHEFALGMTYRW